MKRWFDKSVVYQIYPLSFKDTDGDGYGDMNGIIEKLDYLKLLGVDILWLSPIYQSPMDDNGYDISDYYAIHPLFGTMVDFQRLLQEVHHREMHLIMDLVVNHTSDEHPWFQQAKQDPNSKYRDYYIFRKLTDEYPAKNLGSCFGGSAWEYNPVSDDYYYHLFSKKQPDLNWDNAEMRQEIYQMMNYWLDMGVDGFRMDVIDVVGKDIDHLIIGNGPTLHERLKEMHRACFLNRRTLTVGETGGATPEIAMLYTGEGRNELDMVFQFEHVGLDQQPYQDKWNLKPLDLRDLKKVLSKWQTELYGKGWNSLYWSNHDQPRIISRWGDDKQYRIQCAKAFGALLHFMQGTPYVYQGEEIGMTNVRYDSYDQLNDIEARNMVQAKQALGWSRDQIIEAINTKGRDNARTPFQWNNSDHGGFSTGIPWLETNPNYLEVNAEAALLDPNSIFHFYRKLIQFRKELDIIVDGKYQLLLEDDPHLFAYQRTIRDESLFVIANISNQTRDYSLEVDINDYFFGNEPTHQLSSLKPYEVQVYYHRKSDGENR